MKYRRGQTNDLTLQTYNALNLEWVVVFDANMVLTPEARQAFRQQHQRNPFLDLNKVNNLDALRDEWDGDSYYYFDADHNVVYGVEPVARQEHSYFVSATITFRRANGSTHSEDWTHNINTRRYYNVKSKRLARIVESQLGRKYSGGLGFSDVLDVQINNIVYRGVINVGAWGTQIYINGVFLKPDLDFIDKDQKWDTKTNCCFYDYLKNEVQSRRKRSPLHSIFWLEVKDKKYKNDADFKPNPDWKFKLWEELNNMPYASISQGEFKDETELWGVSISQVADFVKKHNISTTFADTDDNVLLKHNGKKDDIMLFAVIDNGHLNPIPTQFKNKRLSLRSKASDNKQKKTKKEREEEYEAKEDVSHNIVWCEDEEQTRQYLDEEIAKDGVYPIKNIRTFGDGLTNLYSFAKKDNKTKKMTYYIRDNKRNRQLADYYGDDYKGQSFTSEIVDVVDKASFPETLTNAYIYDLLTLKPQKDKAPRGFRCIGDNYNSSYVEYSNEQFNNGVVDFIPLDINKCYKYVCDNFKEPLYKFNYKSELKKYNGEDLEIGLYFVECEKGLLFSGSKFYSLYIVQKGLSEGIITKDDIKWFINAYEDLEYNEVLKTWERPKNPFKDLFADYAKKYEDNKDGYKMACNLTTGLMGRDKKRKPIRAKFTEQVKDVQNFLVRNNDAFHLSYDGDSFEKLYLYGIDAVYPLIYNNLPIYNQILDQASVLLYNKVKLFLREDRFNKCAVYFHTDKFIVKECDLKDNWEDFLSKEEGGVKTEHFKGFKNGVNKDFEYSEFNAKNWEGYFQTKKALTKKPRRITKITNSDQYEELYSYVVKNKSIIIDGDGGTGKSYIINNLKLKKLLLAPTNKASNKIGAKTIHSGLALSKDLKLSNETIDKLKKEEYDCVILDEFSMVNGYMWVLLGYLIKGLNIPLLAFGDWGQIPPVLEEDVDFETSQIVNSLFQHKITLTHNHRQNGDFAPNLTKYKHNMKDFPTDTLGTESKLRRVNICWTNKTRMRVNRSCSRKFKPKNIKSFISQRLKKDTNDMEGVFNSVKKGKKKKKQNQTQDIMVYVGTPLMSRVTKRERTKDGEDTCLLYNNEEFVIINIESRALTLDEQIDKKFNHKQLIKKLGLEEDTKKTKSQLIAEIIENDLIKEDLNMREFMVDAESKERKGLFCSVPLEDLQKTFLVSWCFTTHKAQGDTIRTDFNIYDYYLMSNKLKYTAVSRATKAEDVNILC